MERRHPAGKTRRKSPQRKDASALPSSLAQPKSNAIALLSSVFRPGDANV
jgi:hypothetical protein